MSSDFAPRDFRRLLADALRLYGAQSTSFLLVGALPVFVAELLFNLGFEAGWVIAVSVCFMGIALEVFATAAVTLLACSVLVGGPTGAQEIAQAALRAPLLPLLLTFVAVALIVAVGAVFLIVPGLVFYAWLLLALTVVIIEGAGIDAAFRRSRELGRGFYARNLGLAILAFWLPVVILNLLMMGLWPEEGDGGHLVYSALVALLSPLETIVVLLLYIDMRVRKEQLDAARLAQQINAVYGARAGG
jgi:hypothetical protein